VIEGRNLYEERQRGAGVEPDGGANGGGMSQGEPEVEPEVMEAAPQ
jgi:hypothetical protein